MSRARASPRFKRLCARRCFFKGPKNSVPSKIVGHEPRIKETGLPSPPLFLILCARGHRERPGRDIYSYLGDVCIHFAKRFSSFSPPFFPAQGVRETFEAQEWEASQGLYQSLPPFIPDLG